MPAVRPASRALGAALLLLAVRAAACPADATLACNARLTGTTRGGPTGLVAYSCAGADLPGPEAIFDFSLPAPATVGFALDDSADPRLELLLLADCAETACLRRHGDVLVADLPAGNHVLVVDGPDPAGADFGLVATCGAGLVPVLAEFSGSEGDCFDEDKTGWLTPSVPRADVLLVLDVSGSMGQELAALQAGLPRLMDLVASVVQDPAFGLTSFVDYSFEGSGMADCWYSGPNYGRDTDYPYRLEQPITTDRAAVQAALAGLVTLDGLDPSEPYTRALHEALADSRVAWRPGSRRLVVTFGDELMHACNPLECLGDVARFPRGPDFGRDGVPDTADDLELLPTVDALGAAGIRWLHVDSSGGGLEAAGDGSRGYRYADVYACLTGRTGGTVRTVDQAGTAPTGESLAEVVGDFVSDELARCDELRLEAEPGWEEWLADPGLTHVDVPLPDIRGFTITTCIPPGTAPGLHSFEVRLLCDDTVVAAQQVRILVGDGPCDPPGPFAARASDLSDCSSGVLVSWDAVAWADPAAPGVVNVYRATTDCAGALASTPIAIGLPGRATSFIDRASPGGGASVTYVVEAEAPGAALGCDSGFGGGAASRACAPAVVDLGDAAFPDGVFATLRASHRGDEVTMLWPAARPLLAGEHFHLLKARSDPQSSFVRVNAEGDLARAHVETDTGAPLQFFDLRVANACEDQSVDEFPPGYDVVR